MENENKTAEQQADEQLLSEQQSEALSDDELEEVAGGGFIDSGIAAGVAAIKTSPTVSKAPLSPGSFTQMRGIFGN
jgi:hypothetical protein